MTNLSLRVFQGPEPTRSFPDLIVFSIFLSLMVLSPVFMGSIYSWAFMSLCFAIFLIGLIKPDLWLSWKAFPVEVRLSLWVLFIWIGGQCLFFSALRQVSAQAMLCWLAYLGALLYLQTLQERDIRRVIGAVLAVALLGVFYGLWQAARSAEFILWQQKETHLDFLTGTYLNRNHFAGYLELSLGLSLGLWIESMLNQNVLNRLLLGGTTGLLFFSLILTGSRLGLLSMAVSLVFFLAACRGRFVPKHKPLFYRLLLSAGLGLVLSLVYVIFKLRSESLIFNPALWDGGRLTAWQDGLRLFGDQLWAGVGLGNFGWFFPAYQSAALTRGWEHLHHDYLELLIELGLIGFLPLVYGWTALWIRMLRKLLCMKTQSFSLCWGAMAGLAAFTLHGLGDFNWAVPANVLLGIVVLGMVIRLQQLSDGKT